MGKILDKYDGQRKYRSDFSRSFTSPFYNDLKKGFYGEEGKMFYKSVEDFEGWKGQSFWRLLWWMLVCCNYLKNRYNGSFSCYLKRKFADFKGLSEISDKEFLNISHDEWEKFKMEARPWEELYGVSVNIFDFIMGDVVELGFVENSYKLDSSNEHFLKVTGVLKDTSNREEVIDYLILLNLPYTLREINKGLYSYCAESVKEYGFCYGLDKCEICEINDICEKNLEYLNLNSHDLSNKKFESIKKETVVIRHPTGELDFEDDIDLKEMLTELNLKINDKVEIIIVKK